jgi:tetratricopeptide (TPR) repeat protein
MWGSIMRRNFQLICAKLVTFLALLAIPAWASGVAAGPKNGTSPPSRQNLEELRLISKAAENEDCKTILHKTTPLIDAEANSGFEDNVAAMLYELVVRCELDNDLGDQAYIHELNGTKIAESSDFLWKMRFAHELDRKDSEAAAHSLESMANGRGAALNSIPVQWIWRLYRNIKMENKVSLLEPLLGILSDNAYVPDELFAKTDSFRVLYARMLVKNGKGRQARDLLLEIKEPDDLVEMSLDPYFRSLLKDFPDVRNATEEQLNTERQLLAAHPNLLQPYNRVSGSLRSLGRPQEALDVLMLAKPQMEDPNWFEDRHANLNWWWDEVGRNYAMLGKATEAMDSFRHGADEKEHGALNVSQTINLAEVQINFDRAADALRTLTAFDEAGRKGSPFGEMEFRFARGCAYSKTGQPDRARDDLTYLAAHEGDNPAALGNLLLCMGQLDNAAESFIRRLNNPDLNIAALVLLSDYDDPPFKSVSDTLRIATIALRARSDVNAAIMKAGGIRRFHIQAPDL